MLDVNISIHKFHPGKSSCDGDKRRDTSVTTINVSKMEKSHVHFFSASQGLVTTSNRARGNSMDFFLRGRKKCAGKYIYLAYATFLVYIFVICIFFSVFVTVESESLI